jgi:hypothetical protein
MPLAQNNDHTRMTRHQLAARIEQMRATQAREEAEGVASRTRPAEQFHRAEKIKRYQAELDRRTDADAQASPAAQVIATYRAELPARVAEAAAAGAPIAQQPAPDARPLIRCRQIGPDGRMCRELAIADLQTTKPLCASHGAAAAAARHAAQQPQEQPDAMTTWETANQHAAACPTESQWVASQQHEPRSDAQDKRRQEADDEAASRLPAVHLQGATPTIPAPPSERLASECPQCHAPRYQRCTNYQGQHCAPHSARKAPAQADADTRAAKHAAKEATAARRATVATARQQSQAETARPAPTPAKETAYDAMRRLHPQWFAAAADRQDRTA